MTIQIYIIKIKKRTFSPIMLLYENSQQRNPEKGQNRAHLNAISIYYNFLETKSITAKKYFSITKQKE